MPRQRELRASASGLEMRSTGDGNTLTGTIALFNTLSVDLGGFREQLAPGCFTSSIDSDIRCLVNHDTSACVGRTTVKTLRLVQDDKGLQFECDLPDTQAARDLKVSIDRKDIEGCSFGFFCLKDEWHQSPTDGTVRTVLDLELFEVSVGVTFPAYTDTSSQLRALFPDGTPVAPEKRDGVCTCACGQCVAGACNICSDPDCSADGCTCPDDVIDPADTDDTESNSRRSNDMAMAAILAARLR